LRLRQWIRRGLVRRDLDVVGAHAKAGEPVREEDTGAREPERLDHARRHEQDLVARAREVVRARGVERRPRDDAFARFSEPGHQLAEILESRHRHSGRPQVEDYALDAYVAPDRVEALAQLL